MTRSKSSRRTSKIWLMLNSAMGWGAIYYGILNSLTDVAVAGFSFITITYGLYVGIGHLDYRQVVLSLIRNQPSSSSTPAATEAVDPPTT
jgi:hypothetical protein